MNRLKLTTSAAFFAAASVMGGAVLAQSGNADLPAYLQALDLQNLDIEQDRDGEREIEGRLPGGGTIEAEYARDGSLIKIEADDVALPQAVIDAVLPENLRTHEATGLFSRIQEIKFERGLTKVDGYQQNGSDLDMVFDSEGRLVEFEADGVAIPDTLLAELLPQAVRSSDTIAQFALIDEVEVERRGGYKIEGRDEAGQRMRVTLGEDGQLLRLGRDEGHRGDHGRRSEHHRGGLDGQARGPRAALLNVDAVAVIQRLTEAGYSQFGLLRPEGPRLVLEATNPAGEAVLLELDPSGEVVRETAR